MKRNEKGNIGTDQAAFNPLADHLDKMDAAIEETNSTTSEQEASQEAFQRMQQMAGIRTIATPESAVTMTGWFDVDMSQLGHKGKLYPEDLKIIYRAARASEIRHWSNLDDTSSAAEAGQHIVDMLAVCCKCVSKSGEHQYSHKDIYEHDKWKLLMMIHDITFPENAELTNPITLEITSGTCKHKFKLDLHADNIHCIEPDELLDKYIDSVNGGWIVKTRSLGDVALKPPTMGVGEAFAQYIATLDLETMRNAKSVLLATQWFALDWRGLNNKKILQLCQDFNALEPMKTLPLMLDIMDKAKIMPAETIKFVCPVCKMEGEAPFRFPNGVKQIFRPISNIESELL